MSDLISRQAAIDAIRDMQAFEDDNGQPYLYLYDVMAVFTDEEELPTIQPEPHWIPVTERLPEVKQRVIVQYADGSMAIKRCIDAGHLRWFYARTVAWMPLPEAFKGVTE